MPLERPFRGQGRLDQLPGKTGDGQAVSLTADTGYFWFFSSSNVELIVKVLDARGINQKFWVFFGALSNVEYTLTVRDSLTGSTKTYQNPSGQFASVGDTTAFDGNVGSAVVTQESVVVEGSASRPGSIADIQGFLDRAAPATSDITPCAEGGASLLLANCRFRVDVHWADSSGHNGSGQPVPLSSDTGYFWFFSDSNVELVVKALDARAVNGNFWVFFGALSNVEYTVTVTDTASGAARTYHNPASTFASLGDTAAFRGGFAVSIETDDALAQIGLITSSAGGVVTAVADDGTMFTLEVPPDAINQDEEVTMTPARATGPFPFAGGLAAGVDLRPAGLVLLEGATLTIQTPSTIPLSEETPVAWNGAGEDFFLFPPVPASGVLQLRVFSLGGYGVARGTDAERQTQLGREPLADDDLLSHQISPLIRAGRGAEGAARTTLMAATTDWRAELKARLDSRTRASRPGWKRPTATRLRSSVLSAAPCNGRDGCLSSDPWRPFSRADGGNPGSLRKDSRARPEEDPRGVLGGREQDRRSAEDHRAPETAFCEGTRRQRPGSPIRRDGGAQVPHVPADFHVEDR